MERRKHGTGVGTVLFGTVLAGVLALQGGCPSIPPPPSSGGGVTAKQVEALLADKLGTVDRDLALWNIQPGLGTVMIEYGRRFALAQLAAQAGDWGMAQYQLKEAMEIQEVGEATRPARADALVAFEQAQLDPLAEDILNKDSDAFNQDAASAIAACNACHVANDHGYVVIQPPVASPEDYLFFESSEPTEEHEHESSKSTSSNSSEASDAPLTWEELTRMVDDTFNTVDRDLTLWNIQPGLGTVMMEYGRRFAMLKFAADAGDWGMAQYQLKEQMEIQEVGEATRPAKADALVSFEHSFLDPLETAIEAQDEAAFNAAYADAIEGCNACHVGTGHPFVRVKTPPTLVQPFLSLGPSNATPPEGESATSTTPPANLPSGMPTLADAEAMIQDRLNTLDRTLTLWNIQPGLGTVMMEYGYRFALAKLAAEQGNWEMAAYQIDEAIEIQEVGETTRPGKASMLASFEQTSLEPLSSAINARDITQFEDAYQSAMAACNACHVGTGHPYVVVQEPPADLVDFLDLAGGGS